MPNKTKVKSYIRNGRTVKAYDRSIKDRIIQVGAALGGIGGAAIGYKRGGILGAGKGLLAGSAIGSLPGAFTPNNKEDSKKVAMGLSALGVLGAGVLGARYGKGLLARKSLALVSYNPLTAERNMMVALGIKANKQLKNMPKDIVDLDTEIVNRLGMSKISEINSSISSFQRKASKPGFIKNKADLLSLFDTELTPEAKGYLISRSRINGINKLSGGDEIREKIYTATLDDIDGLYKSDSRALKNYKAISKALSDPKISPGEKAAYQAQLGKYSDKFSSKVIVDRLKNLGFKEIDIKEMKEKLGSDGLFTLCNKLVTFARKKGSKDKKKRKVTKVGVLIRAAALPTLGAIGGSVLASKLARPGALRFVGKHIKDAEPRVLDIARRPITGVAGAVGGYVGYKGLGELNKATINKEEYYTPRSKDKKYRIDSKVHITPEKYFINSLANPYNYIFG